MNVFTYVLRTVCLRVCYVIKIIRFTRIRRRGSHKYYMSCAADGHERATRLCLYNNIILQFSIKPRARGKYIKKNN